MEVSTNAHISLAFDTRLHTYRDTYKAWDMREPTSPCNLLLLR